VLDPTFITTQNGKIVDPEDLNDTVVGFVSAALEDEELGHSVHEKAANLRLLADGIMDARTHGEFLEAAELMEGLQHVWN